MSNKFDALVIGGGITGVGIARDLSMRGLSVLLLERNDIASGATGRSHGLLHSGGRYVVKDPHSARECAKENKVLRYIAGHVIEHTGGLFVRTIHDPEDYVEKFEKSCRESGVTCERLTIDEILDLEPNLHRDILLEGFFVNDAAIDPFKLTLMNMLDALNNGAEILTYHEVVDFIKRGNQVIGVIAKDKIKGHLKEFYSDIVINATGAWSGKLGSKLGLKIPSRPSKGSLIVFSRRIFNMVINRLRQPSDGDIFVPSYSTTILGTTSIEVNNPDDFNTLDSELITLYNEGSKIYPDIYDIRPIRTFAGPRPLIGGVGREASRTFTIIDHETEDDLLGIVTISGGKLTTYRLMAEKLSDLVMSKIGGDKNCRTHKEPLPGYYDPIEIGRMLRKSESFKSHVLRTIRRWGSISINRKLYSGGLVCFCENVSSAEIKYSINETKAMTIGDIMRRTRASMGPCQGQNCIFKLAGLLFDEARNYKEIFLRDLIDHLRKRWRNTVSIAMSPLADQDALFLYTFSYLGNLNYLARMLDHLEKGDAKDDSKRC